MGLVDSPSPEQSSADDHSKQKHDQKYDKHEKSPLSRSSEYPPVGGSRVSVTELF